MILCPHCGATNQDGSKFCNTCGQPLPTPTAGGVACPQCGAENERGAVFCDECGARLRPATSVLSEPEPVHREPIKGLSLPKKQTGELRLPPALAAGDDIPEDVPPWLEKLLTAHGLMTPQEIQAFSDRAVAPPTVPEPELAEEPAPPDEAREPEAEEIPEPLPARGEDELDWLSSLREAEAEEAVAEPAEEEEALPDWLHGLREPAVEAEPAPPAPEAVVEEPEAEEEGLPDWLRDLGEPTVEAEPTLPAAETPPDEAPTAEEEELPDWLRALGESPLEAAPAPPAEPVPPPAEPPTAPAAEEEELPAWLTELQMAEPEEEAVVPPTEPSPPREMPAPEEPDQVPDWLKDLGLAAGEEVAPSETPAFVTPEVPPTEAEEVEEEQEPDVEIPEWLQEIQRAAPILAEERPEETAPPDVTVETGPAPVPDWLQGPAPSAPEEVIEEKEAAPPEWLEEAEASVPPVTEAEEPTAAELPSWLEELQPTPEAPAAQVPPFIGEGWEEISEPRAPEARVEEPEAEPEGEVEGLARAEIPDWLLALRPRELDAELTEELEIMELSGPLAGIKGVLPVEPVVSLPHLTRPEREAVEVPPVSGDLLAEVVAQPPMRAAPLPRRRSPRVVAGVQRVLIYLLMLAAVIAPLLLGPIYGPLDAEYLESDDLQGGARIFYELLNGQGALDLPADSAVLIVFDYHPATAAELSLQAKVIVEHLMSRGLRIMAFTLYPEGTALASDILDEAAESHDYVYGENYIHLGYLPNQPASVRDLLNNGPAGTGRKDYRNGQPAKDYPVAQGVDSFSALRLVVNLTGDERTLQTWVEQMTAARSSVPVVAGVSAATAPYIQPYLDSGQLKALLVGLPGAAKYEAQTGRAGDAINSLGSQAAAQAVIILLMVIGNLVHLATRGGKK